MIDERSTISKMAEPPKTSTLQSLPEGFLYQPDFVTPEEETELLRIFQALPFEAFDFRGYIARRRIVEYGWEYDFGTRKAATTQPIPEYLLALRARAADFAGLAPEELVEAVVTEYPPGAPIGWHRDVPQFEVVVGISLGGRARMRFKAYAGRSKLHAAGSGEGTEKPSDAGVKGRSKITSIILEPRSIYILSGAARWKSQHSIPAVEELRYSITFRSLRRKAEKGAA